MDILHLYANFESKVYIIQDKFQIVELKTYLFKEAFYFCNNFHLILENYYFYIFLLEYSSSCFYIFKKSMFDLKSYSCFFLIKYYKN